MSISVMQVLHQGGGAGSVTSTLHLSLGLAQTGFQVRFVCPAGSEVEAEARARGLEVHGLSLEAGRRRANARRLATVIQSHPVGLINSQSARDREALTWLRFTGRLRVPLVVTRRQMPRTFPLENWVVSRLAARIVAVSPAVGQALVQRGTPQTKVSVIPNGLVVDRIDRPIAPAMVEDWRRRIAWDPSRRTIGIVSRPKDQHVVLRALQRVTTPVLLVLAGVDPAGSLGHLATKAPPRHRVVCVPFTAQVRELYELLELVLLPSRIEGLSQALLEAMALAKPVAASAAAGNVDLITHGVDGRLVEPLDPAAWARVIDELLDDEPGSQRMAAAARETARERFSLEHTVRRTAELYRSLLGVA